MYLTATKYVGGWEHRTEPEFDKLVKMTGITPHTGSPHFTIEISVMYWRKANAIHKWFVDNVQEGRDECQTSYVSREQLEELRDACKKVLNSVETVSGQVGEGHTIYADGRREDHFRDGEVIAQQGIAEKILPTQEGFFFGKTDYDEDYLLDLKETAEALDKILSDKALEGYDFDYRASW